MTNNNGYTCILPPGLELLFKLFPNFRPKYMIFPNLFQTQPSCRLHTIQILQMIMLTRYKHTRSLIGLKTDINI